MIGFCAVSICARVFLPLRSDCPAPRHPSLDLTCAIGGVQGGGEGAQKGSWGELVLNSDRQLPPQNDVLRRCAGGHAVLYNERKLRELPHLLAALGRTGAPAPALSIRALASGEWQVWGN